MLEERTKSAKLVFAYFGEFSGKEYETVYSEVANHASVSEKFTFLHLKDKDCATKFGVSTLPGFVLFRQFDESPLVYTGSVETTPIVDFMLKSSVPTLIDFNEDYIEPIFG